MDREISVIIEKGSYILWEDATSSDPWTDYDEIKQGKLLIIQSMGLILAEDENKLILTLLNNAESEQAAVFAYIPKANIIYRKDITLPQKISHKLILNIKLT